MRVSAAEPYKLVYSLVDHPQLGCVVEPHVVQVGVNGQLTLTHQQLFTQTAGDFTKNLQADDIELIALTDLISHEAIFKRFYEKTGKRKLKPHEWFAKHIDEELKTGFIKPFVEKVMQKIVERLAGKNIYVADHNGPASMPVKIAEGHATVLFHFRRNQEGTRYFATIKHGDSRVDFMKARTRILCNKPAFVLVDDIIYHFENDFEAKRLTPFLTKKWVEVKPESEDKYFKAFVVPLLERFDVYAEGFEIINEQYKATPILSLQVWNDRYLFALSFKYGDNIFHYHSSKRVHVKLEKKLGNYTFRKVRRSKEWEDRKKDLMEKLGLVHFDASMFMAGQGGLTETLDWIRKNQEALDEKNFVIEQKLDKKYFTGSQSFEFDVQQEQDWFDVYAVAKFGEFEIPFTQLKPYIQKGQREFILPNGDVAVLPEEWMIRFNGMMEYGSEEGDGIRLKKQHAGLLDLLWQNEELREEVWARKLKDMMEPEEADLPNGFSASLRPYQKQGYDWFYYLQKNKFGGILADDMGLGKTIQALCMLQNEKERNSNVVAVQKEPFDDGQDDIPNEELVVVETGNKHELTIQGSLFEQKDTAAKPAKKNSIVLNKPSTQNRTSSFVNRTSLIVVPTSLVYNWQNEALKFSKLNVHIHLGQVRRKDIKYFKLFDVVITSYGTLRSDIDLFREMVFNYIILDESQSIKNINSATAKAVIQLRGDNKVALTGTPIENSITDLWSQMNFVNPGLLGSYQHFLDEFANPIEKMKDERQTKKLQALTRPFILRRTKGMVAQDLPPKLEHIKLCGMTDEQEELYEKTKSFYRNQILQCVADRSYAKNKLGILQGLMKLRQISNHPVMADNTYTGSSGKYDEVGTLAQTAIAEGHKLIIFSQFVKHLEVYKDFFDKQGIPYLYLDGSTPAKERRNLVDSFQKDTSIRLFLISLKAGGFGLNLTAADYVFLLDPWWNPAIERQAQDRSHRIGQDKSVFVYKFITKGSIEEKIVQLQHWKSDLADSIIQAEESLMKKVDAKDLLELLQD
ncbi:MAG: ATP-dependent helicase [Flavobacteriaceae bacterium]|nr:ATP-dependent helicase [Flavobacteriaceae bacterium]